MHRRAFYVAPKLLGYGTRRVLVSAYPNTQWWTPSTGKAPVLAADASGERRPHRLAVGGATSSRRLLGAGDPPDTSPNWPVEEEDTSLGPWSLDDTAIAGNNEVTDDVGRESSAYLVY